MKHVGFVENRNSLFDYGPVILLCMNWLFNYLLNSIQGFFFLIQKLFFNSILLLIIMVRYSTVLTFEFI